jgi:predicted transglutaminase-like cysteine proteinase
MKKRLMGLAALCAALCLDATSLVAGELDGRGFQPIAMKSNTKTPVGARQFCVERPGECRDTAVAPGPVALTKGLRRDLDAVNRRVNGAITAVTDQTYYGQREVWTYPDKGFGDCEDFALEKRRELMRKGWPASALRMALVRQRNGEAHAVLVANTDSGDFVLDNLVADVLDWSQTSYKFVKMSSPRTLNTWIDVEDDRVVWVASK